MRWAVDFSLIFGLCLRRMTHRSVEKMGGSGVEKGGKEKVNLGADYVRVQRRRFCQDSLTNSVTTTNSTFRS